MDIEKLSIRTRIGTIAIFIRSGPPDKLPLVLLHGIYFDHHLWDKQVEAVKDRTVIAIDMPLHGESRENIKPHWTLNDCAIMLIEILNSLDIPRVIAVGHSWG